MYMSIELLSYVEHIEEHQTEAPRIVSVNCSALATSLSKSRNQARPRHGHSNNNQCSQTAEESIHVSYSLHKAYTGRKRRDIKMREVYIKSRSGIEDRDLTTC